MIFYTDGSAHPNPGPGGFGVVIVNPEGKVIETYAKHCDYTTNNAEELKGILYAAYRSRLEGEPAVIYSDSAYAINSLTKWMYDWQRNDWVKKDGNIPENLKLIKAFYDLNKSHNITFYKVKGHSKNSLNELADSLATSI